MTGSADSIFSPQSPQAQAIAHLFVVSLVVCAVIFAIVGGLIVVSLTRYKWRAGEPDPHQIAGSKRVEIAWTAIPFVIVLVLFGLTVRAMQIADPPPIGNPDLVVVGHQWWWEIQYPKSGFTTANEIHIPVGRPISVRLDSADVLHEFWVPQLTRKTTTVPMAGNHLWLQADKPGIYEGLCTEFCGTQHAWMRFEVVAESEAQFEAWQRAQRAPAPARSGEAEKGWQIFRQMSCISCHAVRGTAAEAGTAAPDLTHLASRRLIGSGVVENTPENLRRWMKDPQQVKPGARMPNFQLSDEQIGQLVAFFETLK